MSTSNREWIEKNSTRETPTPEPTPARPRVRVAASLAYRGVPVTLELLDPAPGLVERTIDRLLEAPSGHWSAPSSTPAPARPARPSPRPAPQRARGGRRPVELPSYNQAGEACCPHHPETPLEGPNLYGRLWCKRPDPETDSGFCSYKIAESEAYA